MVVHWMMAPTIRVTTGQATDQVQLTGATLTEQVVVRILLLGIALTAPAVVATKIWLELEETAIFIVLR